MQIRDSNGPEKKKIKLITRSPFSYFLFRSTQFRGIRDDDHESLGQSMTRQPCNPSHLLEAEAEPLLTFQARTLDGIAMLRQQGLIVCSSCPSSHCVEQRGLPAFSFSLVTRKRSSRKCFHQSPSVPIGTVCPSMEETTHKTHPVHPALGLLFFEQSELVG